MTRPARAIVVALVVGLVPASTVLAASLSIYRAGDAIEVASGSYSWRISTRRFSVLERASVGPERRLGPGAASVEFLGSRSIFRPPEEVRVGEDWAELRGWVDRGKQLWYCARYQFYPGRPFVRLVVSLMDRHDGEMPAASWFPPFLAEWTSRIDERLRGSRRTPFDAYWKERVIRGWRLDLGQTGGGARPSRVVQVSSHSWSAPGKPWVEVVGRSGAPYQWWHEKRPTSDTYQLGHVGGDGANQVFWHPLHAGPARLTAGYVGFPAEAAHRRARRVQYQVVAADGSTRTVITDQGGGPQSVDLGVTTLGPSSVVRLLASGDPGEGVTLAGSLRVRPEDSAEFEVRPGERHPGVLASGGVRVAVKDFWQHHPIALQSGSGTIGWEAIVEPELWAGGMGLTIETLVAIDGTEADALDALYAPPPRRLPVWLHSVDGTMAPGTRAARFDALLAEFIGRHEAEIERTDAYGWRNWGDYAIGSSYSVGGQQFEEWGNLQYDLPHGLLVAWLRTGDPRLWRFAQASVRHLMDIDLVKFAPYTESTNGLGRRKGETPREQSHVLTEAIVDQAFGFRSLLLYHSLTGEHLPRDLAQQQIRRLAWYATYRRSLFRWGDRPAAWILRGVQTGADRFPDDRAFDYDALADSLVDELVASFRREGRLPGVQLCWQGQLVEGLILHHQRKRRADVAHVIVSAARDFLTRGVRQGSGGRLEFLYCHGRRGDINCPEPQWQEEFSYAALWLGSVAYAHTLSGDPALARRADELFAYLEANYRHQGESRHWTSLLSFPYPYLDLVAAPGAR